MSSRPELLGFALALFVATPLPVIAQMTIVNPVLVAKAGAPQFQVDPFFPKPLPNNWLLGLAINWPDVIWQRREAEFSERLRRPLPTALRELLEAKS
jgi:hypothetical protein